MLAFAPQFLGQVRLKGPARLGQMPGYYGSGVGYTTPRETAFRIIDENGFHVVNPGRKFPYAITNLVLADGTVIPGKPIQGTAVSEEGSLVRIPIQLAQDPQNPITLPVDATLSLYAVNGNVTYPVLENRRIRFTTLPSSQFPLDLEAIYRQVLAAKAQADADKYAADTAAQDEIMAQKYANMIATEEQAKAAADAAQRAAVDAAAKKKAADDAAAAAEAARAAAANEKSAKNKTLLYAVGGLAALGVISYFAFYPSGK